MKKVYLYGGIILGVIFLLVYLYVSIFLKGDTVNQFERETLISRGTDKYEVTILNGSGTSKVYQTVSKVTSDSTKGYYYFWASVNGKRVYVQSPIAITLIEEK
jgi:hypothetical protein